MASSSTGWPPEHIEIELPWEEAIVLYELLRRYQEAERPELVTDRAEWRALVLFVGRLERNGAAEIPDYERVLDDARRAFARYEGAPF